MGSPSAYSLRALETARECVILGARPRTIAHLTGLTPGYILRAVYCERYPAPIGRPQYSEDFFFKTTRRLQAEACFLATHYRRLTREGFMQADALIAAFRHHRATQPDSTFGFDQAFFLISRLDGIWAATKSGLSFVECLNCRSPYLAPHGMAQRDSCPVCRTDWRLKSRARARVRASSPPAPPVDPPKLNRPRQDAPWQLDLDIAHVRLVGRLQQLGAGDKVLAVLAEEPRAKLFRAPRGRPTQPGHPTPSDRGCGSAPRGCSSSGPTLPRRSARCSRTTSFAAFPRPRRRSSRSSPLPGFLSRRPKGRHAGRSCPRAARRRTRPFAWRRPTSCWLVWLGRSRFWHSHLLRERPRHMRELPALRPPSRITRHRLQAHRRRCRRLRPMEHAPPPQSPGPKAA